MVLWGFCLLYLMFHKEILIYLIFEGLVYILVGIQIIRYSLLYCLVGRCCILSYIHFMRILLIVIISLIILIIIVILILILIIVISFFFIIIIVILILILIIVIVVLILIIIILLIY
jgi:hypothetical protein